MQINCHTLDCNHAKFGEQRLGGIDTVANAKFREYRLGGIDTVAKIFKKPRNYLDLAMTLTRDLDLKR